MYDWEKMFQQPALDKGKREFQAKRVVDLRKEGNVYSAAVLEKKRFDVKITMENGKPKSGKCSCPVAKGRSLCEHMAALLYVIEDEKKRQEKKKVHEEEEKERRRLARERRKKEKKQREEQKKQKEEEKRLKAEKERQKKEEERAKQERAEAEARRKEERRRREEEARRKADERQRKEAERLLEEQRKAEEEERRRRAEQSEKKYTLFGESWEEEVGQEEDEKNDRSILSLENYRYFDMDKIRASAGFSADDLRKGRKLYQNGAIALKKIEAGFQSDSEEVCCQAYATAQDNKKEIPQTICFSRGAILGSRCGCPKCVRSFYSYGYSHETSTCEYTAALTYLLQDWLEENPMGVDATDLNGSLILHAFGGENRKGSKTEDGSETARLRMEPKLSENAGKMQVSFRIGDKKMYVVKNLDEFCENVKNSADAVYGTATTFNHDRSNFTEDGKRWLDFINKAVREEHLIEERMRDQGYYYGRQSTSGRKQLDLYGWRLDDFFSTAEETGGVEYESPRRKKTRQELKTRRENPDITIDISEEKLDGSTEFQGIRGSFTLPAMYEGTEGAYYIKDGYLNRTDPEFAEKLNPLLEYGRSGKVTFAVGRNKLNTFYYHVLPRLAEVARIQDHCAGMIDEYLTPEVKFVFYLDAEEGEIFCRIMAKYARRELSVVAAVIQEEVSEFYRDIEREMEVFQTVEDMLPLIDEEQDAMSSGTDEDRIWRMMNEGVDTLLRLGEVRCTDSFRSRRVIRHVKTRVGVSVSEGLLELEVSADGLERKELEELLESYRMKKKYHKLTNGAYISLEDDSAATLEEIMKTLSLSPKELTEGKVNLPLYRALYLDRMLAENDEIYSRRDTHFKELVKEFKTIDDSDFEEPAGLSDVMRNYQKAGFKWMRTLETWNLGGILADDMGLGKTLQTIALLLSAKLEGRGGSGTADGPAIVVSPAALVYNWEEELDRFAPELSVQVITGNQGDRKEKIEAYMDFDVLITSYDTLRRDIHLYSDKKFSYEIIDEAQYIKNHATAAAKAVKVIDSRHRFALTGTPIENRLSELWSIFDYLMPGFLYNYETFRREIETPVVKEHDEEVMKRLQKMTGPFILRRLKENVLRDLPEKLEEIRYVRFEGEQKKLYDAQALRMQEMLSSQGEDEFNRNRFQILAELTRLRQICCAPSLCFENYHGETAKTEACVQLIRSAMDGGHRMLVFSQFTSMLDILEKRVDEEGIEYFEITGSTSKEERIRLVKEFNSGRVPVFFISLKAGGVGLNLTGADVVIHYDPWWNQAVQNQATDRAHRIGQTKKVTVYKLIAKNTIEEKIQKLQETKQNLADQIISGEGGQISGMSREDILALLER